MREDFERFFDRTQFYAWDASVSERSMAWEAWIENKMTFWDALILMLPAWAHPRRLQNRFDEYKVKSAKRLCLLYLESDGSFYLGGHRFIIPDERYDILIRTCRKILTQGKQEQSRIFAPDVVRRIQVATGILPWKSLL